MCKKTTRLLEKGIHRCRERIETIRARTEPPTILPPTYVPLAQRMQSVFGVEESNVTAKSIKPLRQQ